MRLPPDPRRGSRTQTGRLLIWFFIPFLLAARVFRTPESLEKRFSPTIRQFFAYVTVIQPATHELARWPGLIMNIILPAIVVLPGLILFAALLAVLILVFSGLFW